MTEVRGLSWGIKQSFLGYLENLSDCLIATNEGVVRNEATDEFEFPFHTRTELDSGGYRLEFKGDLRIKAHGGMLLVIFMNPWLTVNDSGAELSVIDLMHWPDTSKREVLGFSETTAGPEYPLILAAEAVETFNNVYQPGEPLDTARLL